MAMTELDIQALNILKQAGQPIDDATCCVGHALDAIKVALTKAPPGWKLVPVEPTNDMWSMGAIVLSPEAGVTRAIQCYCAMLAAAPEYQEVE